MGGAETNPLTEVDSLSGMELAAVSATAINSEPLVSNEIKGTEQHRQCHDSGFIVLFLINITATAIVAALNGGHATSNNHESGGNHLAAIVAIVSVAVSLVLSLLTVLVMMMIPSFLIKMSLISNLVFWFFIAVAGFISDTEDGVNGVESGIIAVIIFLLALWYNIKVWSRIPFATSNLITATTAIKENFGVVIVAYTMAIFAAGWSVLWAVAYAGVANTFNSSVNRRTQVDYDLSVNGNTFYGGGGSNNDQGGSCSTYTYPSISSHYVGNQEGPSGGLIFFLLFSYFFTHQVIQNLVRTIVSGVVGTWWFAPKDAKKCWSPAIWGSATRALTTSFGSICFGSLLAAIIQTLYVMVHSVRRRSGILGCCCDCILNVLKNTFEYFNKWSFVYVGLYGYSYIDAGGKVMTLFKTRGWDVIITDSLVGWLMVKTSLVIGVLTAIVGGFIGFFVGFLVCSVLSSTIVAAVDTVIVCFAEAPAEFEANYPKLSEDMCKAWNQVYPGMLALPPVVAVV